VTGLLAYPLLTAALYYLGSWALVTRWLWSRYPPRVAAFAACASCSGFWYGVGVAAVGGWALDLRFLELPPHAWWAPLVVGLCAIVWTPLIARPLLEALERLGGGGADVGSPEP
jgi:hypothetical protein